MNSLYIKSFTGKLVRPNTFSLLDSTILFIYKRRSYQLGSNLPHNTMKVYLLSTIILTKFFESMFPRKTNFSGWGKLDFPTWTQSKSLLTNNHWRKLYQLVCHSFLPLNFLSIFKITLIRIYYSHQNLHSNFLLNQLRLTPITINSSRPLPNRHRQLEPYSENMFIR